MYVLEDAKPIPEAHKTKSIVINGVSMGRVEPTLVTGELRWHAVIELTNCLDGISAGLAQGHGDTPDAAILDAIVSARRCRDRFSAALVAVEKSLNTTIRTSEQLIALCKSQA